MPLATEQKPKKELDEFQKQAVMAGEGVFEVVAGPGAGKTTVLTGRVARLIKQGMPHQRILAITFSSAAAEEMRVRIARLVGIKPDDLKGTVCTFHSLGFAIIRRNRKFLPFHLRYDSYDFQRESTRVLKSVLYDKDLPLDGMKLNDVRGFISLQKRADKSHEELLAENNSCSLCQVNQPLDQSGNFHDMGGYARQKCSRLICGNPYIIAYWHYEDRKRKAGIIDFDDMIFLAWRLLRDHAEVRIEEQSRCQYVLVDEFHDTDIVQMQIAMDLAAPQDNFFCVCDSNQSIYGWRGADPRICLEFEKFYPEHKKIFLGVNYRSVPQVVDLYKSVIETAKSLITGFLEAIRPHREEHERSGIEYLSFGGEVAEASWVASTCKALRAQGTDEIAILYRTNKQAIWLEQALFGAEVPYVIFGSRSFFNRAEIKDLLAFLRILENRNDNEALERIIRSGATVSKYLGAAFLRDLASAGGDCWVDNLIRVQGRGVYQRKAARKLYDYLDSIDRESQSLSVTEQLELIFNTCGLVEAEGNNESYENSADNMVQENLLEIIKVAASFKDRRSFLAYIDKMSSENERSYGDDVEDPVRLMTIHRSKGLEFSVVFLVGADEDTLPHRLAQDKEEERRIAYVAVSRAKDKLFVTSRSGMPSRFFASKFGVAEGQELLKDPEVKQLLSPEIKQLEYGQQGEQSAEPERSGIQSE